MKHFFAPAAAVAMIAVTPAQAQQLLGAEVGVFYQEVDNSDNTLTDFSVQGIDGGLDFGLTSTFALGASFALLNYDEFDDGTTAITGRVMYTPSQRSALGLFYASESEGDFETNLVGIEGAYKFTSGFIEAHYASVETDLFGPLDVPSTFGLRSEFGVSGAFTIGFAYEAYTIEDLPVLINGITPDTLDATYGDTSFVARYSFAEGASVYGKIGRIKGRATEPDETFESQETTEYVTIGAQYQFSGGTFFKPRSLSSFGG